MTELNAYIKAAFEEDETDCMKFWSRHYEGLPKAIQFGHGGLGSTCNQCTS